MKYRVYGVDPNGQAHQQVIEEWDLPCFSSKQVNINGYPCTLMKIEAVFEPAM